MFHKRTGQIAAILVLLSVSAQPMTSHAGQPIAPAEIIEPAPSPIVKDSKVSLLKNISIYELRDGTKTKLAETQTWVKEKASQQSLQGSIQALETKIDRLQDQVKPVGRSIKSTLKSKAPAKGLVQLGDRKVSVYGLMLIMAFGIVLFLMSAANPTSRLGGRH